LNIHPTKRLIHSPVLFIGIIVLTIIVTSCVSNQVQGVMPPATQVTATQPLSAATPSASPMFSPTQTPFIPTPAVSPATTPTPSPLTSASPSPTPFPTAVYIPSATPFKPTGPLADLFQYTLGLINQDRQNNGIQPVTLTYKAAAQTHAQDMFSGYFMSHWGLDGLKPYMRYTIAGGLGSEQENSAYSGWFDKSQNPNNYLPLDVKNEIKALEDAMMAEVPPNDGHRKAILNKWATSVNLGIANDTKRLAMAEEFESDYIQYTQPPTLSGNTLSLSGRFTQAINELNNITIYFDPLPTPLTTDQLNSPSAPHSYALGGGFTAPSGSADSFTLGHILAPPPPCQYYSSLPASAILATKWDLNRSGQFSIQADISQALASGKGVYTFAIIVKMANEITSLSSYSIWVN
jgi:uncharacterized protein YkwD